MAACGSSPGRLLAAVLAALGAALAVVPPAARGEPALARGEPALARGEPAMALDRAAGRAGQAVTVRLAGWPAGTVMLEVCGNEARNGSTDCAVADAVNAVVGPDGTGSAALRITTPAAPCPCVVRARSLRGGAVRATALSIPGARLSRNGPATARAPTVLAVTGTRVADDWSGWPALFAGPAVRTVTVTIRNAGRQPVLNPRISMTAGRPGHTTTIVPVPPVGELAPGQQRTVALTVAFGAPTWGRYAVRGELTGADEPLVFHGHTHSYPWGLLLSALAVAGLALIRLLRRGRARVPSAGHD